MTPTARRHSALKIKRFVPRNRWKFPRSSAATRPSSKVYDTFREGYADRRQTLATYCQRLALLSAPDWHDVTVSDTDLFTFYRVASLVFSIFARRILRADGAKGEGAAAPVRYDGDGGRAFHLPDLSPAPSPEVPLNNNFDRQIGVVHISGFDRYLAKLSALAAVPLCDGRATRRPKPGNQPAGSPRTKQRFAFSSRLLWPRSFFSASSFLLSFHAFSIAAKSRNVADSRIAFSSFVRGIDVGRKFAYMAGVARSSVEDRRR